MSSIIDYPTFGAARAGTVHLRSYADGAERSRDADLVAIMRARYDAGSNLVILHHAASAPDLRDLLDLRWRDERLVFQRTGHLIGCTVELYRQWRKGTGTFDVFIDDFQAQATGWDTGHDDRTAKQWLAAASRADLAGLERLTGLNYETFAQQDRPEHLAQPCIWVVGRRRRRDDDTNPLGRLMGGTPLITLCDSIVHLDTITYGAEDKQINATAHVLKHRHGTTGSFPIERSDQAEPAWWVTT